MKKIALKGKYGIGKYTLVDDESYKFLNKYNWFCDVGGYVYRNLWIKKTETSSAIYTTLKMHRLIMNPPKDMVIDHINHDLLDNRRSNLRICTQMENVFNRRKPKLQRAMHSIFKGVHKRRDAWIAQVTYKGKHVKIQSFDNEIHAAVAYDLWTKDINGEFASLNFF